MPIVVSNQAAVFLRSCREKADSCHPKEKSESEISQRKPATVELKIDNKNVPAPNIESLSLIQVLGYHHAFVIDLRQGELGPVMPVKSTLGKLGNSMESIAKDWLSKTVSIKITPGDQSAGDKGEVSFVGIISMVDFTSKVGSLGTVRVCGFSPTIMLDLNRMYRIWCDMTSNDIISGLTSFVGLPNASISASSNVKLPGLLAFGETPYQIVNYLAAFEGWWAYYDGLNFNVTNELPVNNLDLSANLIGMFSVGVDSTRIKNFNSRSFEFMQGNWFQSKSPNPTPSSQAIAKAVASSSISKLQEKFVLLAKAQSQTDLDQKLESLSKSTYGGLLRSKGSTDRLGVVPGRGLKIAWGKVQETKSRGEESFDGLYLVTRAHHQFRDGRYNCEFNCIARDLAFPYYELEEFPDNLIEVGVVTDNNDPENLGRVKVLFGWETQGAGETESPFIRVCQPQAGKTPHGAWILPEIDDSVAVSIRGRHLENAMVIGSLYDGSRKPRNDMPTKDNMTKSIYTKSGNEITLKDDDGKEQIIVKTKGDTCSVTLDASSGSEKIGVCVKKDSAKIVLDGAGKISMEASNSACKVELDGSGGGAVNIEAGKSIKLKANDITIQGATAVNIKSDAQITQKANATLDIDGGAMVNVKGAIIKLN